MDVRLEKASVQDAPLIFDIQVKAFIPLLEKYKDYDSNPANETIERMITRINNPNGAFYKIIADDTLVGGISVFWKEETQFWISPMFILPSYQGGEIAQKAIMIMEDMFTQATTWELATLVEEKRNCYLYEKWAIKKQGLVRS